MGPPGAWSAHSGLRLATETMADGDGLEAILAIRKLDPAARIVAVSGGSPRLEGVNMLPIAAKIGAGRVLYKPFSVGDLLTAVEELLAEVPLPPRHA